MKNYKFFFLLPALALGMMTFQACTDLEPEFTDSLLAEGASGTFAGNAGDLLVTAYNDLGAFTDQANIYSLTAHTSDEMIPPTRGTDWGDNGVWRTLHAHTWDASHAFVTNSWNQLNSRVFRCNQVLASTSPAPTAQQAAEAKFLRAFYMYHVMDFWGKVPFRNVGEGVDVNPRVLSRAEAFDFVEQDLLDAMPNLPAGGPGGDATKASKAAANALLARLYLNKGVYLASNPAGPYTFDNADMDKVIAACDAVIAAGYTLDTDYFNIFKTTGVSEKIFTHNGNGGNPENRLRMTLHYDQNPSGWNGFATLADFYAKFENGDQRKGKDGLKNGTEFEGVGYGFLVGQQYKDDGSQVINSRTGLPLAFTPNVPLLGAGTADGIRVIKYHKGNYGNYIFFRLGDVMTMKAEAQLRKGDAAGAKATVDALRAARGAGDIGTLDLNKMYEERGREMYWEGVRRTDQIRFGTWSSTWSDKSVTDPTRVLFPIPQQALDSNPNLRQNDGY
ncbi:MAG TPA: RagB/SusD family nutrient uptake outer membrane protein [Saprospirales bacterium]|nr:RagB/SusD family nutrient uptake outer membrane protein [Saprospirales bacterium]